MPDLQLDDSKRRALRIGLTAVMVAVALGLVLNCVRNVVSQDSALAELNGRLAEAHAALDEAKAADADGAGSAAVKLGSARKAGDAVSDLQNAYVEMTESNEDEIKATSAALADYFADSDAAAGCVPWASDMTEGCRWEFATSLSTGDATIPSLWLLRSTELSTGGRVMMYALADYDVESGTFSALRRQYTTYGTERIEYTPSTEPASPQPSSDAAEHYDEHAADGHADIEQDAIDAALADVEETLAAEAESSSGGEGE